MGSEGKFYKSFGEQGGGSSPVPAPDQLLMAENPAYRIVLDGYFYLDDFYSFDAQHNLNNFLYKISVSNIGDGLNSIAGGVFNLFIDDLQRNRLIVVTDRFGLMPLYYYLDDQEIYFSGEPLTFVEKASIFDVSCVEFLKYGFLPFSPSVVSDVQRLLPGQVLEYDFASDELTISPTRVFEFKPLTVRETDPEAAAERLYESLQNIISRLPERVGLSTEQDAGFAAILLASVVTGRGLTIQAGRDFDSQKQMAQIRANSRATPESRNTMSAGVPANFRHRILRENAHIIDGSVSPPQENSLHLDTLLANMVFNSETFTEPPRSVGEKWRYTIGTYDANTPIREILYYQQYLYDLDGALPDTILGDLMIAEREVWFLNASRGILEANRIAGQVHEDFLESLNLYTLIRCRDNSRSITAIMNRSGICPFADYDLMQACFDIDKSLRFDSHFVHFFLTKYFPKMAGVSPLSMRGKASWNRTFNRALNAWLPKRAANAQVQRLIAPTVSEVKNALADTSALMPAVIVEGMEKQAEAGNLSPVLWRRFLDLGHFLRTASADVSSNLERPQGGPDNS